MSLEDVTRPVFQELPEPLVVLFYLLSAIAVGLFAYGLALRVRKFRQGHGRYPMEPRAVPRRLAAALWTVATHTTIGRDDLSVRLAHFLTFWGFIALFVATAILTIDYDLMRRLSPPGFWRGPFFLAYEVFADAGGVALIAGVLMLMARRWLVRPARLDYARVDLPPDRYSRADYARGDAIFLLTLLGLALTGFLLEGARIAAELPPFAVFSFGGTAVAAALALLGVSAEAAEALRAFTWWLHAVAALVFVAYLPYGKGVHMFLDVATLTFRDPLAGCRLPAAEVPA